MAKLHCNKIAKAKHISVVTPCFNEQDCIVLFYDKVSEVLSALDGYTFSILFIDDGSTDTTMNEIKRLEALYGAGKVQYVSFSRNFGKESAIYAGLTSAKGDLVVLMDADLQHPPGLLPEMLAAIEEGYESCAAYRKDRKGEPPVRSFFARKFYGINNSISSVSMNPGATDFRLMTRKMVDAVISLNETERFTKGLFQWVGFSVKWIMFTNVERADGQTKFSLFTLFKYAINGIIAFSTAPLRIASVLGVLIVTSAFAYMLYILLTTIIFGVKTTGFATVYVLVLFLGGIIITLLGIIGEYIARIYLEVKRRPAFVMRESNISHQKNDELHNRG